MMKKFISILITSILFVSSTYALKTEHFDISSDNYLSEKTIIRIVPKNINYDKIDVYIWPNKLVKISSPIWELDYILPKEYRLTPLENTIKLEVYDNQDSKKYEIGRWPVLTNAVITTNPKNKKIKELELSGYFSGDCYLYVSQEEKWKLDLRWNYAYAKIPEKLPYDIYWGYVDCNDLKSNWLDFSISKSPYIRYVIAKDKGEIQPWKTILIKWDNFKLNNDDEVQLFINGDPVNNFSVVDKNTIQYTLEDKNDSSLKIQVKRNYFLSNELKIAVIKYPYIEKVNTVVKNWKNYFRLLWYFPKELWDIKVKFWNKSLEIDEVKEDYIDVAYPEVNIDPDWKIKCSYYIEPDYFSVEIGNVKSNNYFYYDINNPKIVSATVPVCSNGHCNMTIFFNKTINDWNIKIGSNYISAWFNWSEANLYFDKLIKKWKITFIWKDCVVSPPYEFDFSENFRPLITQIESSDHFNPLSRIDIIWEKINSDGTNQDLEAKIQLKPDVLDKSEKVVRWYSSITAFLTSWLIKWTKVDVSLSNKNWKSNWGYFVIWGEKSYMGNPFIKYVSYENWWEWWQKATIWWINFSDKCEENQIYFDNQVIYPDECSYSKLKFTIPKNLETDEISVEVNEQKSENFELNSTIWWTLISWKEFSIKPILQQKIVDLHNTSNLQNEFQFKFNNTLTDILISRLTFKIESDSKILPFYEFVMEINWNPYKIFYSYDQKKFIRSRVKNIWYINKTNDGYEVVFENVVIPFNIEGNEISISFKTNPLDAINNTIYKIKLKDQNIYYYNLYSDSIKPIRKHFNELLLAEYKLINKPNICFDVEKNFKHCSLALKWWDVKFANSQNTDIETKKKTVITNKPVIKKDTPQTNNNPTQQTNNNSKNTSKKLTKREKIANKLTVKKMELINEVLKKFIIDKKRKYWNKKPEILYVLWMYKGWKKMVANTKENYENKLLYVDGLIEFAQNYYKLKNSK